MAGSSTEVANFALGHLGVGKYISDLDTEQSAEAKVCRRFYKSTFEDALRDWDWPFATKTRELALVEEDPTVEWRYSYTYPSDCLKARRILDPSGSRRIATDALIPFRRGQGEAGPIVFCDLEDAQLEYTVRISDVALWPSDFAMAVSYLLASRIASTVLAGKAGDSIKNMIALYGLEMSRAKANAYNEEKKDRPPVSEFISSRGEYEA